MSIDTTAIIAGSLGLVASFAWRDAWTVFIDNYFPLPTSNVKAKFVYAILITMFILLLFNTYLYLNKKYTEYEVSGVVQKMAEYVVPVPKYPISEIESMR
jgi:TRAP-type C4-dicarboxylate transport system permease small subunit